MVRSALEGISLNVAGLLEVLSDQIAPPEEIRATGGFTASALWLQLQADVFGRPISLVSAQQPTAAGRGYGRLVRPDRRELQSDVRSGIRC